MNIFMKRMGLQHKYGINSLIKKIRNNPNYLLFKG